MKAKVNLNDMIKLFTSNKVLPFPVYGISNKEIRIWCESVGLDAESFISWIDNPKK